MDNRKVLITGASGGIGSAVARSLCKSNFHGVLHYNSNVEKAEFLQREIILEGGVAHLIQFDINDREDCKEKLLKEIEEGPFYGIVCNAGIYKDNVFPAMSGEDWDNVINTNLNGFYNVLHPVIMPMIHAKTGGRIVTISSLSGQIGNRGQTNYSAAKAGLIAATKSLAIELGKRKITVNCVAPGIIDTEMVSGAPLEDIIKNIPLGRIGQPAEVAHVVDFLFSDKASYITRQVLSVNGGII